jgi:hypothetical protein
VVVIDTEEEFDWSAGYSRGNTSVSSMRHLDRIQRIFDEYGIVPTYVIDYPVASQPDRYRILQQIHADGRCVIGAHLHPWVNPPFQEPVNPRNSFPGNLPRELELAKLRALGEVIGEKFGAPPVIYKAGRYGIGVNTEGILEELGYEADLSVCPCMDFSPEEGPDFSANTARPFWFGSRRQLLELPLSAGFAGRLRGRGYRLHNLISGPALQRFRLTGAFARLGLLDKIRLSPEGHTSCEHVKLVRALRGDGIKVFSFAFHSPSVEPGHTPYVRTAKDLEVFLDRCRRFFDFFLGEFNGVPSTPLELKTKLGRH